MEIDLKTTNKEKVTFRMFSIDQIEIWLSLDLKEYEKLTDLDIVDCAKIAYNNINTSPSNLMAETAIDLEGTKIYMGYWKNDDIIEIHGVRKLSEDQFKLFIDYRNENQNLN